MSFYTVVSYSGYLLNKLSILKLEKVSSLLSEDQAVFTINSFSNMSTTYYDDTAHQLQIKLK